MELMTLVQIPSSPFKLTHQQHLLLMGSCFAEEVGRLLQNDCFRALVNPFGTLYNPLSIAQAVNFMQEDAPDCRLFQHRGLWHSWLFHSRYSAEDKQKALAQMQASMQQGQRQLAALDVLFLTWGTNRCYQYEGQVVANCHKMPDRLFTIHEATVEEVVEVTESMLQKLWRNRPTLQVVLTVSPIRYQAYGLHQSQLSKAVLLLAADALCRRYPGQVHYFPAYEIVMDELRDYRYYADDMVHPTPRAVQYVYERLTGAWVSTEEQRLSVACRKIQQARQHRPMHPESEEYQVFLKKLAQQIEMLKKEYPYLDID